ncbi:MAG: BadF/BadG/BcrA/BcrD ATPase family protein [Asticcacaulis sp.]
MAQYFLGIDGGGSNCRARLRDADGRLIGEGISGSANIRLGLDLIWGHIMEATDQALTKGGLNREALSHTAIGLGLAGITSAADAERTVAAGPRFAFASAGTDAHAAVLGAFSGRDGAILITGTGSAGYAWVKGEGHAVGGWGFEVSDDGSAAALGRDALRVSLHAHDGLAPRSAFTQAVMARFGGHPSGVVAWVTEARPKDYGTLAPLILSHAQGGDPVAVSLVERAAQNLGRYMRRLNELGAPKICLVGGMAEVLTPWLAPWTRPVLAEAEHDAIEGALLMAHGAGNGLTPAKQEILS